MREIVETRDGSHTVAIPEKGVMYHSVHGAIQESKHVYINAGLHYAIDHWEQSQLAVFEMGFGTGLNAFLTAIDAAEKKRNIHYTAIETTPLFLQEAAMLNYTALLHHNYLFQQLHQCPWNEDVELHEFFTIRKVERELTAFMPSRPFHVIYYDAFAPSAQPELWTKEVFEKLYHMLCPEGVLVTYCTKGIVKRAIRAAGFTLKKRPGPAGKREMLFAIKIIST